MGLPDNFHFLTKLTPAFRPKLFGANVRCLNGLFLLPSLGAREIGLEAGTAGRRHSCSADDMVASCPEAVCTAAEPYTFVKDAAATFYHCSNKPINASLSAGSVLLWGCKSESVESWLRNSVVKEHTERNTAISRRMIEKKTLSFQKCGETLPRS